MFTEKDVQKHTACHRRFLGILPTKYQSEESNRLAIIYFSLCALKLLNTLDIVYSQQELDNIKDYIYSLMIKTPDYCGFKGSHIFQNTEYDLNLASTCFALQCLLILNDDLKRVDRKGVINFLKDCQIDGGFRASPNYGESDLRYCMIGMTIRKILKWDSHKDNVACNVDVDLKSLKEYIWNTQCYDGGLSQSSGVESHSGLTFCGVSALKMGKLLESNDNLLDFLVSRQINFTKYNEREYNGNEYADMDDNGGFNGRLNKYGDTCYVFWCVGSLKLFDKDSLIDKEAAINFLTKKTYNEILGGFNKTTDPTDMPDPLHSFLGLAALSILMEQNPLLDKINCEFVIPMTSYMHWESLKFES
ncbi:protein geranylgeranyltransferase type I subunit [Martiniozyma asiatica (nom. inval.)]|nr:protein geranylgeranyltransferase type I subunit [Martiniozyma asiatica]